MAKSKPADVIDAYRQRQKRKSFVTFGDVSKVLLLLVILASLVYALITGGPELPTLVELKTNTPTFTPSNTPAPTQTATISSTPTNTPDPNNQCDCPSPEILIVTATFIATDTVPFAFTATATQVPTQTALPTDTLTPSPSATSTATQIVYIVQGRDTLSAIALRFGVTVEAIQTLNNLDTTFIYTGQVLQIPNP
ncbi:MAG: LysM peptidoglycan-binding domain-containing protein [Anaerolineales bacterium]